MQGIKFLTRHAKEDLIKILPVGKDVVPPASLLAKPERPVKLNGRVVARNGLGIRLLIAQFMKPIFEEQRKGLACIALPPIRTENTERATEGAVAFIAICVPHCNRLHVSAQIDQLRLSHCVVDERANRRIEK